MRLYGQIQRIDEDQRMVWGYASTEQRAADGLVITRAAMQGALDGYLEFPAVREMHQLSAVGRTDEATVDDTGLYVGVKVVDDSAWTKVTERVYRAFSIGAKITERDAVDRTLITGLEIREISLVDRPSDPGAKFDVWRAADPETDLDTDPQPAGLGAEQETDDMSRAKPAAQAAQPAEAPAEIERTETAEPAAEPAPEPAPAAEEAEAGAVDAEAAPEPVETPPEPTAAERAQAAVAGLEEAVERAVAAEPAPEPVISPIEVVIAATPDVRRGLYTVADLGQCLSTLAYIIFSAQYEAEAEGDNSPVPAKLKEAMKALADGFKAMAVEEVNELLTDLGIARAAPAGDDELARLRTDNDSLTRALGSVAENVERLTQRVAELAAQPAPPRAAVSQLARAVPKEADAGGQEVGPTGPEPSADDIRRYLDEMPEQDRALYVTRAALARPVAIRTR